MSAKKTKKMVYSAFIGTLVLVIAKTTRFSIIPQAPHLKMEFGDVPLLLLIMFGTLTMALQALLMKELLSFFIFGSNPLSLSADFFACAAALIVFSLVWKKGNRSFGQTLLAAFCAALARMLISIPVNLVILPLQYGTPIQGVIAQMVYFLPFNALKSIICGFCVALLYPRLKEPFGRHFSDLSN